MKKFEQLKKLYATLEGYIDQYNTSEAVISGTTADFDRLFELAWKTMKEYLQREKMMVAAKTGSPRDIVKLAYQEGLIDDEEIWLEILNDRNDDSHHFRKADAILYVSKIQTRYMYVIKKLIIFLSEIIPAETINEIEIPQEILKYCKDKNLSVIGFLDELCTKCQYSDYNQIYENWNDIKKTLQP